MWTSLKTVFGIDLRTLALFRVMLGIYVIIDVCNRWPFLKIFYSDQGIHTRAESFINNYPTRWSLLYLSGLPWVMHMFFALTILAAICLIIGYRTRIATIVCWCLVVSIANRNMLILQGHDELGIVLLFWSIFLPLGARFSFDDALRQEHAAPQVGGGPRAHTYFSAASVAILLQVSYVYIFGAFLKSGADWTQTYDAIFYALSLESVASSFGEMLLGVEWALKPMTLGVFWLELLMPFIVFCPLFFPVFRITGMVLLIGLHLGFVVFMNVGLFPLTSITSLLLLTPPHVWRWLDRLWSRRSQQGAWALFYDDGCTFCRKTCLILRSFCLPYETNILPAQADPIAGPILEAENSWVVRAPDRSLHGKWEAVCLVLKQNPITWIKGTVFSALPNAWGQKVYDAIGENRTTLGAFTATVLPLRPLNHGLSRGISVIVIVLTVFAFLWNVDTDPDFDLELPPEATQFASFMRLTQRWSMFAPVPAKLEGWYGFEGTLADGSKVDLWTGRPGYPPVTAPDDLSAWLKDYRWRKLLDRLHQGRYRRQRGNIARAWCAQDWTGRSGEAQALASVKMTFYGRYTQPDGRPDRFKDFMLYNKPC